MAEHPFFCITVYNIQKDTLTPHRLKWRGQQGNKYIRVAVKFSNHHGNKFVGIPPLRNLSVVVQTLESGHLVICVCAKDI